MTRMKREDNPDPRLINAEDHAWHRAINDHHDELRAAGGEVTFKPWMYEAKAAAHEASRLQHLFAMERTSRLPVVHTQCSHSAPEPVADNHLTCCLGVEARKCPELAALDKADLPPDSIDRIKAWTCVGHILSEGGDVSNEGYLTTVDDRMFWDRVHDSLAAGDAWCMADLENGGICKRESGHEGPHVPDEEVGRAKE